MQDIVSSVKSLLAQLHWITAYCCTSVCTSNCANTFKPLAQFAREIKQYWNHLYANSEKVQVATQEVLHYCNQIISYRPHTYTYTHRDEINSITTWETSDQEPHILIQLLEELCKTLFVFFCFTYPLCVGMTSFPIKVEMDYQAHKTMSLYAISWISHE